MDKKNLEVVQLFDGGSSTYTYILYDKILLEGLIIDPVLEQFDRDYNLIKNLEIKLRYVLETHIHADHITSAYLFKEKTGSKIGVSMNANVECADLQIDDGQEFSFGTLSLKAIKTPGHTQTCLTFQCENNLFTGDTLLIRKCGRTDFQGGSADELFMSVRERIFSFPDDYKIYPGHDYNGFTSSSIGEEKKFNTRLALNISKKRFIEIMDELNLPYPKKIDFALPRNLKCGQDKN